jgi:hypothetical protein
MSTKHWLPRALWTPLFFSLLGSYATLTELTYPGSSAECDIVFEDLSSKAFNTANFPIWYMHPSNISQPSILKLYNL